MKPEESWIAQKHIKEIQFIIFKNFTQVKQFLKKSFFNLRNFSFLDRKVRKEGGKIKEIFVEEIFSHFSNLNRNLGTQISSNLKLTRSSDCKDGNSILDSVNLVKTDLDESKKENQESNIKEKVKTLDKILKEENVLKRMSELKSAVMNMSETELDKMLKKFKNSAKYHYILESCGAAGTLKVYKAVLKALPPSTSQSGQLGNIYTSN